MELHILGEGCKTSSLNVRSVFIFFSTIDTCLNHIHIFKVFNLNMIRLESSNKSQSRSSTKERSRVNMTQITDIYDNVSLRVFLYGCQNKIPLLRLFVFSLRFLKGCMMYQQGEFIQPRVHRFILLLLALVKILCLYV